MENTFFTTKVIIYICIAIVVIIICRIVYNTFNYNVEGFDINNNTATDLLSKIKSTSVQQYVDSTSQSTNTEMSIHSWNNKIYNMMNITQPEKTIALYKPTLTIDNVKYSKLGDIICQNTDYSPPNSTEFSILVKQNSSDIKPPVSYELMVDIGDSNFDNTYYDYANYINNTVNIREISTNLINCSAAFTNLSSLINNNLPNIQKEFKQFILENTTIGLYSDYINLAIFVNSVDSDGNLKSISSSLPNKHYSITIPAGITGYITNTDNHKISIDLPSSLDSAQDGKISTIYGKLPVIPFGKVGQMQVRTFEYPYKSIFEFIPILDVINYIKALCTDIQAIYINQSKNTNLLNYLKLAKNKADVDSVLSVLNSYSSTDTNILLPDVLTNISQQNVSITDTSTLLNLVLYIINKMELKYYLSKLFATPGEFDIPNPQSVTITGFNYDIISNIPNKAYQINSNSSYFNAINHVIPSISSFSNFIRDFSNKTINYFPLQIYKPIAPDGYTSLGHVFCNVDSDLQKIKTSQNVACIPSNCIKEIRDWIPNDKVFEYNKNGVYWAIFFNPYTGTFISTNTNAQQLPSGKVCKVVACVAKCTAVDTLEKADDCTRKYYNLNKKLTQSTPVTSTIVSDQEEVFYLDKIKAQSDSITRLKNKAQNMQTSIDKATIVNREMNKNKLQNYVDTQKTNIDTIMNRLENDKNKIQTNVKIPLATINEIIKILQNPSIVEPKIGKPIVEAIIKNQTLSNNNIITDSEYNAALNNILSSCPQYDFTDLVSKAQASDVCYGCDNPK